MSQLRTVSGLLFGVKFVDHGGCKINADGALILGEGIVIRTLTARIDLGYKLQRMTSLPKQESLIGRNYWAWCAINRWRVRFFLRSNE